MKRKEPLKADPERVRDWQRRSAEKAQARKRARPDKRPPVDAVREAISKANPPRPDPPKPVRKRRKANPGNNPTPPLPPGARCVNCGKRAVVQHHVTFRQELRRRWADAGSPRSVAPMCTRCHGLIHEGGRKVHLTVFPDDVIQFALEVLREAAPDYLARRYDSDDDPRPEDMLKDLLAERDGNPIEGET